MCHTTRLSQNGDSSTGQAHALSENLATNSSLGLMHGLGSQRLLVEQEGEREAAGGRVDVSRRADLLGF